MVSIFNPTCNRGNIVIISRVNMFVFLCYMFSLPSLSLSFSISIHPSLTVLYSFQFHNSYSLFSQALTHISNLALSHTHTKTC